MGRCSLAKVHDRMLEVGRQVVELRCPAFILLQVFLAGGGRWRWQAREKGSRRRLPVALACVPLRLLNAPSSKPGLAAPPSILLN